MSLALLMARLALASYSLGVLLRHLVREREKQPRSLRSSVLRVFLLGGAVYVVATVSTGSYGAARILALAALALIAASSVFIRLPGKLRGYLSPAASAQQRAEKI